MKIGRNNKISALAKIYPGVVIGDDNFIGDHVVLYPNVVIGDRNTIYNKNVIGEYPVMADDDYYSSYDITKHKGVVIGNDNFLHVDNVIFAGIKNPTYIGNRNRLLVGNHTGHDAYISEDVTSYPNVIHGGYSVYLRGCSIGMGASVHQERIVGQYSMVGGGNLVSKHVFPYFVNIGGKMTRLNIKKIPFELQPEVIAYEQQLRDFVEKDKKMDKDLDNWPPGIQKVIQEYQYACSNVLFHRHRLCVTDNK
jgi:acyl-[acyl carrier protein]--UDP-N-acetylglucosamine O-acyltransferase